MQISLRLAYGEDVREALAADELISKEFPVGDFAFWVNAESEAFERILQRTKATEGLWLTPECAFTKAERAQVNAWHFQAVCRKTLHVRSSDDDVNVAHLDSLPLHRTPSKWGIKRMERICVSAPKVPSLVVAGLGWSEEYVVGAVVAKLLKKEALRGLELRPVYNPKKMTPHDGVFHLYTESLMPPVIYDASVLRIESLIPLESGVRALGALCYNFEGDESAFPDFHRTAEPFSSNWSPFWIVSRRVVELFDANKIRGWEFRPVLKKGTALYEQHLTKWEQLRDKLASNPRHRFSI